MSTDWPPIQTPGGRGMGALFSPCPAGLGGPPGTSGLERPAWVCPVLLRTHQALLPGTAASPAAGQTGPAPARRACRALQFAPSPTPLGYWGWASQRFWQRDSEGWVAPWARLIWARRTEQGRGCGRTARQGHLELALGKHLHHRCRVKMIPKLFCFRNSVNCLSEGDNAGGRGSQGEKAVEASPQQGPSLFLC